jgi:hypothetical protein
LVDSAQAATAVQDGFTERYAYQPKSSGARDIGAALSPISEFVESNIEIPTRRFLEDHVGDGLTTSILGIAQAGLEIGGLLIGGTAFKTTARGAVAADRAEAAIASAIPAEEFALFRRVKNQGAFSELSVLMDLKTVRQYAAGAGVGLEGVKVRIIRDESLIGKDLYGYTHPNGKSFDIYPDAFQNPEQLIRTLGHERTHVYQIKTFGRPKSSLDLKLNESAAVAAENYFLEFSQRAGGK